MPLAVFKIRDRSMEPTIKSGDYVIVSKVSYSFKKPKAKDIIVLRHPTRKIFLVKRIARINGDKYFVIGDNKTSSTDSREFGPVGLKSIVGKVVKVIRG